MTQLSKRIAHGALLVLGIACSQGCLGEPDGAGPEAVHDSEHQAIVEMLRAAGFDARNVSYRGEDEVVVEGDMVLSRAAILKAHETLEEHEGPVPKGYWYQLFCAFGGSSPFGPTCGDQVSRFLSIFPSEDVSSEWRDALRLAAREWDFADLNVQYRDEGDLFFDNVMVTVEDLGNPAVVADATLPPNRLIRLNSGFQGPPNSGLCAGADLESLPAGVKARTAIHEFGHILGFKHPGEGQQIPDTLGNSQSSIMRQGCFELTSLAQDDINSVLVVFPE